MPGFVEEIAGPRAHVGVDPQPAAAHAHAGEQTVTHRGELDRDADAFEEVEDRARGIGPARV